MKGLQSIGRFFSGMFRRNQNVAPKFETHTVSHDPSSEKDAKQIAHENRLKFLRGRFDRRAKHHGENDGSSGKLKATFVGGYQVTRAKGYEKAAVRNTTPASQC